MEAKYELDGYTFVSASDFERAKKEKETIAYLQASTDMTDMKAVYKIYKNAVEKKSFQTVFGLDYMRNLRNRLIGSSIVTADLLDPIPVGKVIVKNIYEKKEASEENEKEQSYTEGTYIESEKLERMRFFSIVKNFLIIVLAAVIGVMLFVTYNYKYSFFTYFTNYKEKMRDEIIDDYQDWEQQLEEREKALEEKENTK